MKIKPTKTNLKILANFFELDEKRNFKFSDKKHRAFIKKLASKKL